MSGGSVADDATEVLGDEHNLFFAVEPGLDRPLGSVPVHVLPSGMEPGQRSDVRTPGPSGPDIPGLGRNGGSELGELGHGTGPGYGSELSRAGFSKVGGRSMRVMRCQGHTIAQTLPTTAESGMVPLPGRFWW